MSDIDILYQISNLKEAEYKNILLITGLIKLLTEKKYNFKKRFNKNN